MYEWLTAQTVNSLALTNHPLSSQPLTSRWLPSWELTSRSLTGVMDHLAQWLTGLPLFWQTLVVSAVAIPMCGLLAVVLLRLIDVAGALTYKLFNPGVDDVPKVRLIPVRRQKAKRSGSRIVINTEPRAATDDVE